MTQDEINREEWENPDNWSGPKWLCMYFSKRDNRTVVPCRIRAMGCTVNFGSPSGVYWFVGSILFPLFVVIAIFLFVLSP